MMARKKANPDPADTGASFEDALAGLEGIVEAMEREQLPLEELVDNYEKGSALLARCESILKTARGRIELITLRNQQGGSVGVDAGNESRPTPPPTQEADANDDDDIRLF
jgi:exodeoxyribonuclease VII small subunit